MESLFPELLRMGAKAVVVVVETKTAAATRPVKDSLILIDVLFMAEAGERNSLCRRNRTTSLLLAGESKTVIVSVVAVKDMNSRPRYPFREEEFGRCVAWR